MNEKISSSRFQEAIETVEALPKDDQALLIEILKQRFIAHRRKVIANDISEAREAYEQGNVHRGTVEDLMRDMEE
ncbi:MAG: hypothetical protein IIA61_11500 [Candidatus Marinimicrobia bacterium]|nr:hypothetical protein [Candidatus Neomarinimicrobiota bacterium]